MRPSENAIHSFHLSDQPATQKENSMREEEKKKNMNSPTSTQTSLWKKKTAHEHTFEMNPRFDNAIQLNDSGGTPLADSVQTIDQIAFSIEFGFGTC